MAEMTSFTYGWFHDVPRCISLRYHRRRFLLYCAFDDDIDEYPDEYSIYVVPASADDSQPICHPDFLSTTPMVCIGKIPIDHVIFDDSKRKELDASVLDGFIARLDALRE